MSATLVEYVWLDGYTPEPTLRSKIRVSDGSSPGQWSFDGSSTRQAEGNFSDCILNPVKRYHGSNRNDKIFVLCEVLNPDGTPHESNDRSKLLDSMYYTTPNGTEWPTPNGTEWPWFGFEQEYFIRQGHKKNILGFESNYSTEKQGKYYCGVGGLIVGRDLSDEHLEMCLKYGIGIEGTNAEVAVGQWEYQIFGRGAAVASDDLWMSRYFLFKLAEKYGYDIELHPKPLQTGDWNGSGLHTNFSTPIMRSTGGEGYFNKIFKQFDKDKEIHIANYGSDNHLRLTGKFETQDIHKFTWGIADRGASIRIPTGTAENWRGYLEDRRPASNANPYKVTKVILDSMYEVDKK